METYCITPSLTIAVVFGGLVTQYYARRIKILAGEDNPEYRICTPISIGFVESLFYNIHTIRFLLLTGTLTSMLFSVLGGLICAGKI